MTPSERNIVFINQATGYLTIDIIHAFLKTGRFHKVALMAGSIRVQDVPLDSSVQWQRISLYDRGAPSRKLLSWLLGTVQIAWFLLVRFRRYEIFYITIPPFAYLLSAVFPQRFSVLVFDVYPDVLTIFNIKKSNLLFRAWGAVNRRIFKRAYRIITLGDGMAKLLEKYVERSRITVIPNWPGLTNVKPIPRIENFFLKEYGLEDKFIVLYSGNIGYTHNVEVVVELAERMKEEMTICFLIIGRGDRYNAIEELIRTKALRNCTILPFQPDNILNYTLAAADLGVVLLDDRTAHASIPSKIYNLQAVGVPLLGIADPDSELARHIDSFGNGRCYPKEKMDEICDFILSLKRNPQELAELRRKSVESSTYFTSGNASRYADQYV